MPNSCSAYKCKERYKKEEKENAEVQQSFFRFPHHNEELLSEWVAAVGRTNWYPSKTSVLCGNHFLENDFVLGSYSDSSLKKKFLKKGAIPSVFSIPAPSLSKKEQTTHEIPARKRLVASEIDNNIIAPNSASSASFFDTSGEVPSCKVFKPAMSPSTKIKKLQLLVKKKNKKIKQLQRKNLRKEKTITGLITQLNKKKFFQKSSARNSIKILGI
ncbi:THAP domain-containing 1-like [Paramuricea clavata]|uniref:THAP domain-containing 1-like n=1 Tax=Paramuricea clavata TaxID=317549 RepID=A0A6S7IJS1_PARCT|nr:THAP domain-containing 1-like [Paramuricea clavata]